jgi:hypothetical protein
MKKKIWFCDLPMNGQRIYHDWSTFFGSQVAEAFNENQINDCLMIGEPGINGNIHKVGLHRYLRRYHTVERREHLLSLLWEYLSTCLLVELICKLDLRGTLLVRAHFGALKPICIQILLFLIRVLSFKICGNISWSGVSSYLKWYSTCHLRQICLNWLSWCATHLVT